MAMSLTSGRKTTAQRTMLLFVAHLLLLALAIRPLHAHELRVSTSPDPQLTAHYTTFCPECTFGSDSVELGADAQLVGPTTEAAFCATTTVVSVAERPHQTPARAPPAL